jgi:hypothetical protein
MKKALVITALVMISFANAQKGTYLVLGNMSFSSQKDSNQGGVETKYQNVGFYPKVGYQFTDNWTVGVETGFSSGKSQYTSQYTDQERITKNFSGGAFVRYSKSLSQMFLFYTDLGAGYQNRKETNTDSFSTLGATKTTFDGVYMNLTPGLFLNIKNNFGLNFSIGGLSYSDTKNSENNGSNSNFYFNFGQSYNVGISKNF